jgi:hypothetical protein
MQVEYVVKLLGKFFKHLVVSVPEKFLTVQNIDM